MERISTHISYQEAVRSNTALRLNIDNTPNGYQLGNMVGVALNIFEPLRQWVGGPIKINSFYRNEKLNTAIGGSKTSFHCHRRAIDLDDTFGHKTNAEMFYYIKENLNFDTIIWKFVTDINHNWVHVAWVSQDENRGRCLRAEKIKGKTSYRNI